MNKKVKRGGKVTEERKEICEKKKKEMKEEEQEKINEKRNEKK